MAEESASGKAADQDRLEHETDINAPLFRVTPWKFDDVTNYLHQRSHGKGLLAQIYRQRPRYLGGTKIEGNVFLYPAAVCTEKEACTLEPQCAERTGLDTFFMPVGASVTLNVYTAHEGPDPDLPELTSQAIDAAIERVHEGRVRVAMDAKRRPCLPRVEMPDTFPTLRYMLRHDGLWNHDTQRPVPHADTLHLLSQTLQRKGQEQGMSSVSEKSSSSTKPGVGKTEEGEGEEPDPNASLMKTVALTSPLEAGGDIFAIMGQPTVALPGEQMNTSEQKGWAVSKEEEGGGEGGVERKVETGEKEEEAHFDSSRILPPMPPKVIIGSHPEEPFLPDTSLAIPSSLLPASSPPEAHALVLFIDDPRAQDWYNTRIETWLTECRDLLLPLTNAILQSVTAYLDDGNVDEQVLDEATWQDWLFVKEELTPEQTEELYLEALKKSALPCQLRPMYEHHAPIAAHEKDGTGVMESLESLLSLPAAAWKYPPLPSFLYPKKKDWTSVQHAYDLQHLQKYITYVKEYPTLLKLKKATDVALALITNSSKELPLDALMTVTMEMATAFHMEREFLDHCHMELKDIDVMFNERREERLQKAQAREQDREDALWIQEQAEKEQRMRKLEEELDAEAEGVLESMTQTRGGAVAEGDSPSTPDLPMRNVSNEELEAEEEAEYEEEVRQKIVESLKRVLMRVVMRWETIENPLYRRVMSLRGGSLPIPGDAGREQTTMTLLAVEKDSATLQETRAALREKYPFFRSLPSRILPLYSSVCVNRFSIQKVKRSSDLELNIPKDQLKNYKSGR